MTREELKPYMPPTHAEYARRQQETIDKVTAKSLANGSTLEHTRRADGRVYMIWRAKTGQRVEVTFEKDGLFAGKLVSA
jgi:flagella basal body P-ring formation protein FlgA